MQKEKAKRPRGIKTAQFGDIVFVETKDNHDWWRAMYVKQTATTLFLRGAEQSGGTGTLHMEIEFDNIHEWDKLIEQPIPTHTETETGDPRSTTKELRGSALG